MLEIVIFDQAAKFNANPETAVLVIRVPYRAILRFLDGPAHQECDTDPEAHRSDNANLQKNKFPRTALLRPRSLA